MTYDGMASGSINAHSRKPLPGKRRRAMSQPETVPPTAAPSATSTTSASVFAT